MLKVLMVGLGGIGQRHLRNIKSLLGDQVELLAYRNLNRSFVLTDRLQIEPGSDLTEKYGIPVEDIILDGLVFPCATGDENYIGGAVETIEGVRLIKENISGVKAVRDHLVWVEPTSGLVVGAEGEMR